MSSQDDFFWRHVHDLLDARKDPLDDTWVRETLEHRPELLEEFADLCAGVRRVAHIAPAPARVERRASGHPWMLVSAIVAVCVLIGLSTWMVTSARNAPRGAAAQFPMPTFASDARVRAITSSVEVLNPAMPARETRRSDGNLTFATLELARHETPRVLAPHGHPVHAALAVLTTQLRKESKP